MARYQTRRRWSAIGLTALGLASIAPGEWHGASAQPPGPESFAVEPRTPLELWGAIDYLTRTGQARKAVPYLERFNKEKINDATWIAIRDRYGAGSILRLDDDAAVRKYTEPLIKSFIAAIRKVARSPERMARFIAELTGTPEEQDFAARRLRESGSYAVPQLTAALVRPGLSEGDHALLVRNLGRLDGTAIPGLAAMLESPEPSLAIDAATALGLIGDPAALPFLAFPAAFPGERRPGVKQAAQTAFSRLTGRPFSAPAAARVLTAAAWAYHRHQVEFNDDPPVIWKWDAAKGAPAPTETSPSAAEAALGLRFAREALRLNPLDHDAQVAQISLALEKSIEVTGFTQFPAKDQATFDAAKASGPGVLVDVIKTAIADGKTDLAAAAVRTLGRATSLGDLDRTRPNPLVEALQAPGRRVQFAAARALVELDPKSPFPGSSRIVPVLSRFVLSQPSSRAIVIDCNPTRGSQIAGLLLELGYDSELETQPDQGFRAATQSADVELFLVGYDLFRAGWKLPDLLANLRADSRTSTIPIFIYGPLEITAKRPNLGGDHPGVQIMVQPVDKALLKARLGALAPSLSTEERLAYSNEAIALLARISSTKGSPLVGDLPVAVSVLAAALNESESAATIATVLGRIPSPDAQRALADAVLDPSRAPTIRGGMAKALVESIGRFGALLSADQESRLASAAREEAGSPVGDELNKVTTALAKKAPGQPGRPSRGPRLARGAAK